MRDSGTICSDRALEAPHAGCETVFNSGIEYSRFNELVDFEILDAFVVVEEISPDVLLESLDELLLEVLREEEGDECSRSVNFLR